MAIESSLFRRLADGLKYSFTELLDDMSRWLIGGLVIAGIIMAMIPPSALVDFSSGFFAMLLMALIGIPMYICAAAATPIAAAMIMAGVSPGTVLVFLLAAPVTSMATLGVYSKEMGRGVLLRYLGSIIFFSIAAGLFVDSIISYTGIDVQAQAIVFTEFLPEYLERLSLGLLIFLAVKPLRQTSMSLVKKTINFFRKI